jgi:integrase
MKVKNLIVEYVGSSRYQKLSNSSRHQYWQAMKKIEATLGDKTLTTIRRSDFVRLHDKLGVTPATANRVSSVASVVFNYAVDMDYIGANPATRIKPYKLNEWSRWDVDEVKKVIAKGNLIVSTAVALAFYTGQRESDILNMKWTDIRNGSIFVKQSKTGKEMEIKMSPDLTLYLSAIPRTGPYIIGGHTKLTGPWFRKQFKVFTRSLGIERTFHGIRKTVGALLAERGKNTNEIAALLGHKTLEMAAKYTRQANETKMISSAVDALS